MGSGDLTGPNGYMQMYRVTASAVKRVSLNIKVGGPASAQLGLLNSFMRHCIEEGLPLDFVSALPFRRTRGLRLSYGSRNIFVIRHNLN